MCVRERGKKFKANLTNRKKYFWHHHHHLIAAVASLSISYVPKTNFEYNKKIHEAAKKHKLTLRIE
jgi:hypothetical protein